MAAFQRDDRGGRPLRLLWLIDSLAMGGAERLTVSFAREAAGAGIDLRVCCLKRIAGNPLEPQVRETGVPCDLLEAANLRDWKAFARLHRVLRSARVDIVHAHLTYAAVWGAAAARLARVPIVATLHVPPAKGPFWSRDRLRERLMCGALHRSRASVIAVSGALRDRYVQRRLIDPSRLVVVPNGIETDRFPAADPAAAVELKSLLGLRTDARVLMATAVLREPRKGLHVLLEAMPAVLAACPAARLVVIGDGPLRPALHAQTRRLGIEAAVHWAGARHDIASLLAGAEIFVHPALEDPFPTAVLEAMAAGLPVVATRVDGIPEMIDSGRTGMLVAPSDAAALAGAISALLAHAPDRGALGAAARRAVRERFSTSVWVRTLRQIYERMVGGAQAIAPARHATREVSP